MHLKGQLIIATLKEGVINLDEEITIQVFECSKANVLHITRDPKKYKITPHRTYSWENLPLM